MELFNYVIAFALGMMYCLHLVKKISQNTVRKFNKQTESSFGEILAKKDTLLFNKRVNTYVYIKLEEKEGFLIYIMDRKILYIYKGESLVASSLGINDSKVIKDLIDLIEKKWYHDINNVAIIDNNIFSLNILTQSVNGEYSQSDNGSIKEDVLKLNIDDILDKINKVGIENLSDLEKDFLEKYSK